MNNISKHYYQAGACNSSTLTSPPDRCCGACEALAWRPTLAGAVYYCGLNKEELVVEDGGDDEVRPSFARSMMCLMRGWKEREERDDDAVV